MANTSPRPVIAGPTGLVTFVDSAGNLYPALVSNDFAAGSASANQGSLDLDYVDTNAADFYPPNDETQPARGRKFLHAITVLDQGNAGVTTTPTGTVTSGSTTLTVTSATGIPTSGFVTGVGIAQGTVANPNPAATLNPDLPQKFHVERLTRFRAPQSRWPLAPRQA